MAVAFSRVALLSLLLLSLYVNSVTGAAFHRPLRHQHSVLTAREAAAPVSLPASSLSPSDLISDESHVLADLKAFFDHIRVLFFPSASATPAISTTSTTATSAGWRTSASSIPLSSAAASDTGAVAVKNVTTTVTVLEASGISPIIATSGPIFVSSNWTFPGRKTATTYITTYLTITKTPYAANWSFIPSQTQIASASLVKSPYWANGTRSSLVTSPVTLITASSSVILATAVSGLSNLSGNYTEIFAPYPKTTIIIGTGAPLYTAPVSASTSYPQANVTFAGPTSTGSSALLGPFNSTRFGPTISIFTARTAAFSYNITSPAATGPPSAQFGSSTNLPRYRSLQASSSLRRFFGSAFSNSTRLVPSTILRTPPTPSSSSRASLYRPSSSSSPYPILTFPQSALIPLRTLCQSPSVTTVDLPLISLFYGLAAYPSLRPFPGCVAANAVQASAAPGLLNCTELGSEVQFCQALGKKVLLSLTGATAAENGNSTIFPPASTGRSMVKPVPDGNPAAQPTAQTNLFTNAEQASEFAATLWSLFGDGTAERVQLRPLGPDEPGFALHRPLGDEVMVDGFDVQLPVEWKGTQEEVLFTDMVARLKQLAAQDVSKEYTVLGPNFV